jgi:putative two-component system response regulator
VDYITKPYGPSVVKARVRTHLSLVRADEVLASRQQVVHCLGKAAELKDNETGLHVVRMSHYSRLLGAAAGIAANDLEDLFGAAPMHDVGKIGIPDAILLKPGRLDDAELAVMRQHAEMGARIIGEHRSGMLAMAREIALCHHEHWDGGGYPRGLAGEAIPLEARIVAIADVFDALTSARPYKKAWQFEDAVAYLQEQRGRHFDPTLVDLFVSQLDAVRDVAKRFGEPAIDNPTPATAT